MGWVYFDERLRSLVAGRLKGLEGTAAPPAKGVRSLGGSTSGSRFSPALKRGIFLSVQKIVISRGQRQIVSPADLNQSSINRPNLNAITSGLFDSSSRLSASDQTLVSTSKVIQQLLS
jgi:hypothetical protein